MVYFAGRSFSSTKCSVCSTGYSVTSMACAKSLNGVYVKVSTKVGRVNLYYLDDQKCQ